MTHSPIAHPATVDFAKKILAIRRIRNERLTDIEFADASWDMLIDLFVATESGRQISVLSLTLATATAKSTALDAISKLVGQGHLTREADPDDGRRTYVFLSPALHRNLDRMLSEMRMKCLAPSPGDRSPGTRSD